MTRMPMVMRPLSGAGKTIAAFYGVNGSVRLGHVPNPHGDEYLIECDDGQGWLATDPERAVEIYRVAIANVPYCGGYAMYGGMLPPEQDAERNLSAIEARIDLCARVALQAAGGIADDVEAETDPAEAARRALGKLMDAQARLHGVMLELEAMQMGVE